MAEAHRQSVWTADRSTFQCLQRYHFCGFTGDCLVLLLEAEHQSCCDACRWECYCLVPSCLEYVGLVTLGVAQTSHASS